VGAAPASGPATTSAPRTTLPVQSSTTTPGFGESEKPITVPAAPPPAASPSSAAAEATARAFLEHFWVPTARTSGQLADAVAPWATDSLLAFYRAPERIDVAVPGTGVGDITVRTVESTPTTAVEIGGGTMVDEPDRRMVFRTMNLVQGADGGWRGDAIR